MPPGLPPGGGYLTSPAIPGVTYNSSGSTVGVTQTLPTVTPDGDVSASLAKGKRGVYIF